jgi:hypothetical protein
LSKIRIDPHGLGGNPNAHYMGYDFPPDTNYIEIGGYNEETPENFVDFACSPNANYSTRKNVKLSAGNYYIVVDGYNGASGDYELMVSYSTESDLEITKLPYRHQGTIVGKTNEFNVQGPDGADENYAFTLTKPTSIAVTLCTEWPAPYDSKLEIFNSNGTTTNWYNDDDPLCSNSLLSTIPKAFLAAGTYRIVVDGYNGAQGDYLLNAEYYADQESVLPYEHSGTTVSATNDWDVTGSDGADIAYRLFMSSAKSVKISLNNSTTVFNTKLQIFMETGDATVYYSDDCNKSPKPTSSEIADARLEQGYLSVYY